MQVFIEDKMQVVENEMHTSTSLLGSKTSQLDDILSEKLEMAFDKPTSTVVLHDVAKIASEHSPIDLAYAACRLPPVDRPIIYENLSSISAKIEFMTSTDSSTRVAIFRHIADVEVKTPFQLRSTQKE